jgi:hypothetical protein
VNITVMDIKTGFGMQILFLAKLHLPKFEILEDDCLSFGFGVSGIS